MIPPQLAAWAGSMGAKLVVLAVVAALSAWGAWRVASWRCQAGQTQAAQDQTTDVLAQSWRGQKAGERDEQQQARIRVVYRDIEHQVDRIVERPVYRDLACALDAFGVQLWRDANRGESAAASEPDAELRAAAGSGGAGDAGATAAQPRADHTPVSPGVQPPP